MSEEALTRDAIFKPREFRRERIAVPGWGGAVYIKQLTAERVEWWQDEVAKQETAKVPKSFRCLFIVECVCTAEGKRLFTEGTDVARLAEEPNSVIEFLWKECKRVNGMGEKAVEDAEKN